jgi:hypothetical protein
VKIIAGHVGDVAGSVQQPATDPLYSTSPSKQARVEQAIA